MLVLVSSGAFLLAMPRSLCLLIPDIPSYVYTSLNVYIGSLGGGAVKGKQLREWK